MNSSRPSDLSLGLYVHVPFCIRRCPYCAFYSTEGESAAHIAAYPDLLVQELELILEPWRGYRLGSVYFGGGTPSLLEPAAVDHLLQAIRSEFQLDPEAEITLEANPGTIDKAKLDGYIRAGINRLSLGIQALNEERLKFLGRMHSLDQAQAALSLARAAGFRWLSVDLMVGTPMESAQSWDQEFDILLDKPPQGISFYSLTLEEGTRLARRAQGGERVNLPQDNTVDLLLHAATRLKAAGYRHYEVSNWALPGSESRHNRHYWRRGSYLGLGPSAHSFDGTTRSWNLPNLQQYEAALKANQWPPSLSEVLTEEEVRSEWVYLNLRQDEGLDLREYTDQFGLMPHYWISMFENLAAKGLGIFNGEMFRPSDTGLFLADEIAARLLG
jgi:oxygen-independent coproporphyrinogen-3 oxidase